MFSFAALETNGSTRSMMLRESHPSRFAFAIFHPPNRDCSYCAHGLWGSTWRLQTPLQMNDRNPVTKVAHNSFRAYGVVLSRKAACSMYRGAICRSAQLYIQTVLTSSPASPPALAGDLCLRSKCLTDSDVFQSGTLLLSESKRPRLH